MSDAAEIALAWPAAFAAAVGITISAVAQTVTGRTVPVAKPRVGGGTNVTPELFAPHPMIGESNLLVPAPAPSVAVELLMPPRLAPLPGSQPIVPAPLAPPVAADTTATTERSVDPILPQPEAEHSTPAKETVRPPSAAAKSRARATLAQNAETIRRAV